MDLRPHLSDAGYWEKSFGPFLKWLRQPGDTSAISGFMTQLTVTGPYVKTLFEQAEVPMPGKGATWDDWAKASKQVADKLEIPIPMAWDRSGHRVSGPAIAMGAKMFDGSGEPALIDEGLKRMTQRLYDWHQQGIMAKELWGSVSGSTYLGANEDFTNAQVVFYMSGSGRFLSSPRILVMPLIGGQCPPLWPAACTGMPGGAALVAMKDTKHPEEVAKLMDWLAQEENLAWSSTVLFLSQGILGWLRRSGL